MGLSSINSCDSCDVTDSKTNPRLTLEVEFQAPQMTILTRLSYIQTREYFTVMDILIQEHYQYLRKSS